jgi:hypothetical protein
MTTQTNDLSPTILQRIDAIIVELQVLRQQILAIQSPSASSPDLVDEMAGSLGQGTWEEYDIANDSSY